MKITTILGAVKPLVFLLAAAATVLLTDVKANSDETYVSQSLLPYGFSITSLQGGKAVDPGKKITLEAVGLATRLSKVELADGSGKILFKTKDKTRIDLPAPLSFGTRYTVNVTAERPWLGQALTRTIHFTTVVVPKLVGPDLRMLGPDASVTLHFDRPVAEVKAAGDLKLGVEADATGQNIRLLASGYGQDLRYEVELNYKTATGAPLPPLKLTLLTPPPFSAETNVKGQTNLGLALPLQVTFSEALANKDKVAASLRVHVRDGATILGKWRWIGERKLRFTPQPAWPASSTIEVSADVQTLRSERGGKLQQALVERFSTGTDRKLFVYLDSQRVQAVENGRVVRTFKVSTGKSKTPTATGSFYIYDRYRHKTMRSDVGPGQQGYYEVKNVPYTQFFHKDLAFHGAFWHNGFGQPASHGCVNLATKDNNKRWPNVPEDAGWLYRWAALGVPVQVLGKAPAPTQPSNMAAKPGKSENKKTAATPIRVGSSQGLSDNAIPVSAPKKTGSNQAPSADPVAAR